MTSKSATSGRRGLAWKLHHQSNWLVEYTRRLTAVLDYRHRHIAVVATLSDRFPVHTLNDWLQCEILFASKLYTPPPRTPNQSFSSSSWAVFLHISISFSTYISQYYIQIAVCIPRSAKRVISVTGRRSLAIRYNLLLFTFTSILGLDFSFALIVIGCHFNLAHYYYYYYYYYYD